jgi:manganese transport protein
MAVFAEIVRSGSEGTSRRIREILEGRRSGWRAVLPFAGPAVIVSVAYMDPGNFATNIQAGASYRYGLLWVVALAGAVAMLFQAMSANLGIVTGRNLAELCRAHFPPPFVVAMWIASEIAAMATDVAECLGAALAISLLAHVDLVAAMCITAVATAAMLTLQRGGFRPLEVAIGAFVAVVGACYVVELVLLPPQWHAVASGLVPHLADGGALTLAVGIVGATVMPHAIYLHSSLTQDRVPVRDGGERRALIAFSNREVLLALTFAAAVNVAMTIVSGTFLHADPGQTVPIAGAYHALTPLLGGAAAALFLVSLLASGISSSAVGTLAGQVIMQGFIGRSIPVWVRRGATIAPAFAVALLGLDPTRVLVFTQVVLSLVLPVPMIALLVFSARRSIMGDHRAGPLLLGAAVLATVAIVALNALLVWQTLVPA